MDKKKIGTINKKDVFLYTLSNQNNHEVQITNYGGIIISIKTPDKNGVIKDITLGYDSLEEYKNDTCYMGAIVGRCCNRIKNSTFTLDGKTYQLYNNQGKHHLHGGKTGFNQKIWTVIHASHNTLQLSYLSPDMEEGYPGNLKVVITYILDEQNSLSITYKVESDKRTVCNLTYHPYFNLQGESTINYQEILINAHQICEKDTDSISNGNIIDISNTIFDFQKMSSIQTRLEKGKTLLKSSGGFDHNWVLTKESDISKLAVSAFDPISGRQLDMYTDRPGVQFYTGNFLDGIIGKKGVKYVKHSGFCIEPQGFPNAPNLSNFPSVFIDPNIPYHSKTIFHFSTKQ